MSYLGASADVYPTGIMLMGLLGGLAIFLFGMEQMTGMLKILAGERMRKLLKRLTTNRFTGVVAGTFVTAVIQSSSITTVLVVGFVSAGLMTLSQAIGVIMGASIGTTITAQLLAFQITKFALALVAIGFLMHLTAKRERVAQYGMMILGFGLLFFGMNLMGEAMSPLREYPPFIEAMQRLDSPLQGVLISAVFTALIQSSSATTAVIIVLAGQGLITIEQGIPLVFGANVGTCVTALLAAIGKSREAIRAAVVHVIFNILGVMLWYGFINPLASLVTDISQGVPRQIANAHTIFNVSNTLVFIWFTTPLAWLVRRIIPERPEERDRPGDPKYLDNLLLQTPSMAMEVVRMELGRLGDAALQMVRGALKTTMHGSESDLVRLKEMDNDVDRLHAAIVTYLARLSQEDLSDRQSKQLHDSLAVANYLESIGDMIETNLVDAGRQRLREGVRVSEATEGILGAFHQKVCWAVASSIRALVSDDAGLATEVMNAKSEINLLATKANAHLSRRLTADEPKRLAAFRMESEIGEYLKRLYYFAKRIAKIVGEQNPDGPQTPSQPQTLTSTSP